jgi:hypothetical protein
MCAWSDRAFRIEDVGNYQGANDRWQKYVAGLERVAAGRHENDSGVALSSAAGVAALSSSEIIPAVLARTDR